MQAALRSPPRRRRYRSRVRLDAEPLHDLAEIDRAEWDHLAHRSGNVFATREWISTWWEVFGADGSLLSFAARGPDGRLIALLPMYIRTGSFGRELRFLGHGLADCLGPICAPEDLTAVADMTRRLLRLCRSSFDRFIGDDLPEHQGWRLALGAETLSRTKSPVLRAGGRDWKRFLATQSANFRQQARRRERRLIRGYGLRYRLADPSRLEADFEALLGLHRARWGGGSRSFEARRAVFHRTLAPRVLKRGWLRLWIAELEGHPAAAWYGFRYGDAEWYYQAGRDPRYDKLSIGFVLLAHTIRAALDDGVLEYKLLRGDEAYKRRFANADARLETVTLASEDLETICESGGDPARAEARRG